MFSNIYGYLKGYINIKISGFSVERFLNLALHKGIVFWDIKRDGSSVIAKMNIKDFKKLKPFCKKTGCKIKICDKNGFPFVINRYRKRKVLVFSMILSIIVLYIFSSMVWSIHITGNERIDKESLVEYSIKSGIRIGVLKKSLDLRELEKDFMKEFEDISWIAISTQGTRINIELAETIEIPQIIDRTTPCDIVAQKDALIMNVAVKSGTPKVKARDVVRAGDILVSSKMNIGEEGIVEYTHASAEIIGKIWYKFEIVQELIFQEKVYTGNLKKEYYIQTDERKINLLKTSILYSNYDKISKVKELKIGEDFPSPLSVIEEEYKEYILEERTLTEEEAKVILEAKIDEIIEQQLKDVIEIVDKNIQYEISENKMKANVIISTLERIDKQVISGGDESYGENNGNTQ